MRDVIPTKGQQTQEDNLKELANLQKFFDNPPVILDEVEPKHICLCLDWRSQKSQSARQQLEGIVQPHLEQVEGVGLHRARPTHALAFGGIKRMAGIPMSLTRNAGLYGSTQTRPAGMPSISCI